MVGALFYWLCYVIVLEYVNQEKEWEMYSQLDLTMRFHDGAEVEFGKWRTRPKVVGVLIGLVPVVRVVMGLGYLGAVVAPNVITRETRLAIDNLLKI